MKTFHLIAKTAMLTVALLVSASVTQAQGNGKGKGKPETAGQSGVKGSGGSGDLGQSGEKGKPGEHGKPETAGKPKAEDHGTSSAGGDQHGKPGEQVKPGTQVKGGEESHAGSDGPVKGEDKENNGNAYGKNKGDLSGREFGQARAAEARSKTEEKVKTSEDVIKHTAATQQQVTTQVATIKGEVAAGVKGKTLTPQQAQAVNTKISEVESKIKALQEAEAAHRALVEKVKAELAKPASTGTR